jgi:hypothetical protein
VPHGAWTTDSHCLEIDVFCPPRQSLLKLAAAQAGATADEAGAVAEPESAEPESRA